MYTTKARPMEKLRKDFLTHIPEMEKNILDFPQRMEKTMRPQLNGKRDKNRYLKYCQVPAYHIGVEQLNRIIGAQIGELTKCPRDLTTSFASAEMAIAKYISISLADVPLQKKRISHVLSLVQDYKVLTPVLGQNPTASLHKVHLILQDNYKDSSLCLLLNVLLAGHMGVTTKTITF